MAIKTLDKQLEKQGLFKNDFKANFDFLKHHKLLSTNNQVVLPTSFKGTPAWRLIKRLVAKHKEHIKVKYAKEFMTRDENKNRTFILALTPTSRDGIRYFAKDAPVSLESLIYLNKIKVEKIKVTDINDSPKTPKELGMLTLIKIKQLLKQDCKLVFSENIKDLSGTNIFSTGTKITLDMIDFLHKSDCRKIAYYDKGWTVLAYVYPSEKQLGDIEFSEEWVSEVRGKLGIKVNDKNAKIFLTGPMLVAHDLAAIIKEDFIRITLWVGIIAALVLIICYRDVKRVMLSLCPILLSLAYLMGFMSFFSIYFNFINVLVVPIIIGLGVDNGIHLVHRFYEGNSNIKLVVMETGRAIVITNLTSMIGFGSLWAGSYKGLTSMGMLSVFGLTMSVIASLVILPSILMVLSTTTKNKA